MTISMASRAIRLCCAVTLAVGLSVPAAAFADGEESGDASSNELSAPPSTLASVAVDSSSSTVSADFETDSETDLRSQSEIENKANSWRYQDGEEIGALVEGGNAADAIAPTANGDPSVTPWTKTDKGFVNSKGEVVEGALYKGIDVSEWDGKIDWDKLKAESDIDFVIIRCGFGQDQKRSDRPSGNQDDNYWKRNVTECMRLGIPFGVYIYSYAGNDWNSGKENGTYKDWDDFCAKTLAKAKGEAKHVLRCLSDMGITPNDLSYPVYYDLEESGIQHAIEAHEEGTNFRELLADMAKTFCDEIEKAGYTPGYYANLYWRTSFLTDPIFDTWDFWIAQYNATCSYEKGAYHLWQFGGTLVAGITNSNGSARSVDTNLDFEGPSKKPVILHPDVTADRWFVTTGVYQYVLEHEFMKGNSNGTFTPDYPITRCQFITILWRMAHEPSKFTNDEKYDFPDTRKDAFYTSAVRWARGMGVIRGSGADGQEIFRPDDPVTREEAAKMIALFNEKVMYRSIETSNTTMESMPDASSVSNWAKPYMKWAVASKVINGSNTSSGRYLNPHGRATRAEAAAMIANFAQNVLGIE